MISKRIKAYQELVTPGQVYSVDDAIELLKKCATVKFTERFDMALNLGIDARKSEQNVRGATVLPHGTGKSVKVAVFTQGDNVEKAKQAGADVVGFEDLVDVFKKGQDDFDVVIASPDAMRIVGQLGPILGPKGLMPNPKVGTVAADVAQAVKNAKSGQAQYRNDKNGIIHCAVGTVKFDTAKIKENIEAILVNLKKLKPANAKGVYFKKMTLSTTMGPGLLIDVSSLAT